MKGLKRVPFKGFRVWVEGLGLHGLPFRVSGAFWGMRVGV